MRDLEELLEAPAERIAAFGRRHGVTILAILVLNMVIIVGLMSVSLVTKVAHEEPITLDFEDPEAARELEKSYQEYEEMLRAQPPSALRNIAVNVNATAPDESQLNAALSDDKHTNAQEIYEEMQRARAALSETRLTQQDPPRGGDEDVPAPPTLTQETKVYKGPSVLNYELLGRTKVTLPVPAYKCRLGGVVAVTIWVNKTGAVVRAEVEMSRVPDADRQCLHDAALEAASRSRFNASPSAPDPQQGHITYQFVPQ